MFDSSNYHGQDLLFKDATIRVVPVGEKTTYRDWLGPDYVAALEGMLSQQCSGAGRAWPAGQAGSHLTEQEQVSCHTPSPSIPPSLSPPILECTEGCSGWFQTIQVRWGVGGWSEREGCRPGRVTQTDLDEGYECCK